jgi:hypothetical protein
LGGYDHSENNVTEFGSHEIDPDQPAAMRLGPGRPTMVASLAQQKSGELLARPAQAVCQRAFIISSEN